MWLFSWFYWGCLSQVSNWRNIRFQVWCTMTVVLSVSRLLYGCLNKHDIPIERCSIQPQSSDLLPKHYKHNIAEKVVSQGKILQWIKCTNFFLIYMFKNKEVTYCDCLNRFRLTKWFIHAKWMIRNSCSVWFESLLSVNNAMSVWTFYAAISKRLYEKPSMFAFHLILKTYFLGFFS